MSKIIVTHKVENFEKWKAIFKASDAIRKLFGEKNHEIFRNCEDLNEVSVLFEWNEPVKAIHYSQSDKLKVAMKQAGVIGDPAIYLLEDELGG